MEQRRGKGADLELFYTDRQVKQDFKDYINMLVSRRNTVTGVTYRDDPTIFAWELANEPHTTDGYEKSRNIKPGTLVRDWVREIAAYVKSIDGNHMVSTGEEGYRSFGPRIKHDWLNNGLKGVDFAENIKDPNIDFATVHLYPGTMGEWVRGVLAARISPQVAEGRQVGFFCAEERTLFDAMPPTPLQTTGTSPPAIWTGSTTSSKTARIWRQA